ncbi:MAG: alanine racemase, partial [Bacillota bacterium]|nr:alanine racemase [Bacillota bacterium]
MSYPLIEIDLKKIYHNAKTINSKCNEKNISVSGVIKGTNGSLEIAKEFEKAGHNHIASSRIRELIQISLSDVKLPTMLIRLPMISEIENLVKYINISLNSELKTIMKIEEECLRQNKKHNIILMLDLGDLREGYFFDENIIETALYIENNLKFVTLYGIATNLSCYGSVMPTVNNLSRLCDVATKIEALINRPLEIISGGATSTLPLVFNDTIPKKINNLRIGEGILLAIDLEEFWGIDMSDMYKDSLIIKCEIIEIKTKPSHPIGKLFIDAFGNKPNYIDLGNRKRALLALGKKDIGDHTKLIPFDNNIK